MSAPLSEPMTTRSVTVREVIEHDGAVYLITETEGDPAVWDQIGMLQYALTQLNVWAADPDDDEDV